MSEPDLERAAASPVEIWTRREAIETRHASGAQEVAPDDGEKAKTGDVRLPSAAAATLGLWLFLLAFGGGCLTMYYGKIRYVPEIRWDEALTYLGVLSIIGACVVGLFALLAFLPGLIWSEALVWDSTLKERLCYEREDRRAEPCLIGILTRIAGPFALFLALVHIGSLVAPWISTKVQLVAAWISLEVPFVAGTVRSLFTIGGLLLAAQLSHREFRADLGFGNPSAIKKWSWKWLWTARRENKEPSTAPRSLLAKSLFWFVVSALLGWSGIALGELILGGGAETWALSAVCTVVVAAANVMVSMLFRKRWPAAVLTGVVAAFIVLAAGEGLERDKSLLTRVMGRFGVGEASKVLLVTKEDARDLLRAQGVPFEPIEGERPDGAVQVSDVSMLSRLGTNYFLQHGRRRFQLPKDEVWSWSASTDPESGTVVLAAGGNTELFMEDGARLPPPPKVPHQLDFTGARSRIRTEAVWPHLVLLVRECPARYRLVKLQSIAEKDRRILGVTGKPGAGGGETLEPKSVVKTVLSVRKARIDECVLEPQERLEPGEYGLFNSETGELAAFGVDPPAVPNPRLALQHDLLSVARF
jgi:hypothetical protein